jgi:tetratricopeptide (TPR) repeat protein
MPSVSASVSVIVTAHNCARYLPRTLASVVTALDVLHRQCGPSNPGAEVVIVDDGSTDDTPRIVHDFAASHSGRRAVRRPRPTSPSAARNAGVRAANGNILFFLDGDDLFLPDHLAGCCRVLTDDFDFVKTGVRLADPVHPDWTKRIAHSLVLNLAVRRSIHDAVGGFPDDHLFRREGDELRHDVDLFFKIEDMFYNRLVGRAGRGVVLNAETVEYCRHPGNSYDRQLDKFRRPYAPHSNTSSEDEQYRLRLAEIIIGRRLATLTPVSGPTEPVELAGARRAQQAGDFRQVERLCRQLVQTYESHAEGWLLLGNALHHQGRHADAVEALNRVVRLAPASAEAHFALGRALTGHGDREAAVARLREAVTLAPAHAEAHSALGMLLGEQGRAAEAVQHFGEAARLRPTWASARHNLGVALAQAGRPEEAVAALQEALRLEPAYAEACYNLGNVLKGLGRRDEAIAIYRRALELRPLYGEVCNNLGLALTEAGQRGEALVVLRQGARLRPKAAEAHNNLGLAYADLGRFAEAEASYEEALRRDPGYAEAHGNLANTLKEQGRFDEAMASYQMALLLDPKSASVRYNRSLALLQAGEWERGWPEYEYRWRRGKERERHTNLPRWDGSPLEDRTILLWCEQGMGDAIQFVRYAKLVKRRGGRVLLECPPRLMPLLSTCPGVDTVVAEGEALPGFDVQCPLLSLPGLLGTTLTSVPAEIPYLHVEPGRVELWRERLSQLPGFKVGVVWQGNRRFQWDHFRSFALAELGPLAEVPGVRLISLQRGHGSEQVAALRGRFEVTDFEDMTDADGAFLDTAAVMRNLDLLVTSCTSSAHLAGALGVPTWLALSAVSDWRWLRGREEKPWYPSVRLFRQDQVGSWKPVFARMAEELRGLVARSGGCPEVTIQVSPGELLDKLTILGIKAQRIGDPARLAHVEAELIVLKRAWQEAVQESAAVAGLRAQLSTVNEALWQAEDGVRNCEAAGEFGERFVGLARSIYQLNDERAAIKRRVNDLLGAGWQEQKVYAGKTVFSFEHNIREKAQQK